MIKKLPAKGLKNRWITFPDYLELMCKEGITAFAGDGQRLFTRLDRLAELEQIGMGDSKVAKSGAFTMSVADFGRDFQLFFHKTRSL